MNKMTIAAVVNTGFISNAIALNLSSPKHSIVNKLKSGINNIARESLTDYGCYSHGDFFCE